VVPGPAGACSAHRPGAAQQRTRAFPAAGLSAADQLLTLRHAAADQHFPAFAAAGGGVAAHHLHRCGLAVDEGDARPGPRGGLRGEGGERILHHRRGGRLRRRLGAPAGATGKQQHGQQGHGRCRVPGAHAELIPGAQEIVLIHRVAD
jgi:hypothetical protein